MSHIVTEASAPGKLILFGEHAVVYGCTAIAGALSDLRVGVQVEINDSGNLSVTLPNIAHAGDADSHTSTWPLTELRASVLPAFSVASDGHNVLRPDAGMLSALEAAAASVEAHSRKPVQPAIFLAVGIFGQRLLSDSAASPIKGLAITVHKPTLPVAAGLGSSAAFSVAIAAALLDAWSRSSPAPATQAPLHAFVGSSAATDASSSTTSPSSEASSSSSSSSSSSGRSSGVSDWARPSEAGLQLVNAWAYAAETLFHGNPSGLDNSVATFGGALAYNRIPGSGETRMRQVAGMPPLRILVTNTKVPKETSKLVGGVRILRDAVPEVVNPILTSIDAIAKTVLDAIEARRTKEATESQSGSSGGASASDGGAVAAAEPSFATRVGQLVRINHQLLNALGVGHAALDNVCRIAAERGWPSKLTGAGGGGCALTLLPEDTADADADAETNAHIATVTAALKECGYACFETRLGGDGVMVRR